MIINSENPWFSDAIEFKFQKVNPTQSSPKSNTESSPKP